MRGSRDLLHRLSLGVVDQMLSSGSNFVALLLGARYLDVDGFGSYSLALVSYTLTLGVTRALCSEALLVRPGEDPGEQRRRAALAIGAAGWVGVTAAAAFFVAAVVSSGALAGCFAVLGIAIPGLLVQDTLRFAAFSRARPRAAVLSDGTWVLGQAIGFPLLIGLGSPTAPAMLAVWAAPGVVGGVLQGFREHVVPRLGSGIGWILRNRDLSVRYALDFLGGAGAAMLASYVLAAVSGVAAVGSIRGAQTLFGPVNILFTGAYIVLVPEGRRAVARSGRALTVVCASASALFAAAAGTLLVLLLLLDPATGKLILGSTWTTARTVLLPVGLASIAGGLLAGARTGLRSLSAARAILRIRLITIPTTLALPIIGAIVWDAEGLAAGIALSSWWNVGWYWMGYGRAVRNGDWSVAVADADEALIVDGIDPVLAGATADESSATTAAPPSVNRSRAPRSSR